LKQIGLTSIFSENKIRVLYVEQELEMNDSPPAKIIFKSNVKLCGLMKESEEIEQQMENYEEIDFDKLNEKYNNFYKIDSF